MANCLNISIVIVALLGIGFLILSMATDYWRTGEFIIKYNQGLFKNCLSAKSSSSCGKLYKEVKDYPAELASVVAMMVLAVLFQAISMIVAVFATIANKKLNACIAVLQFLACGAAGAGLAVYVKYYQTGFWKLGWSYALGWAGTGFIGIGLILLCVIMVR